MKRLILNCLMAIGTIMCAFSQTTYPKKVIVGSDTVLAITKCQLLTINRSLNRYEHLLESYSLLERQLDLQDSIIVLKYVEGITQDSIIREQQRVIESTYYQWYASVDKLESDFSQYKEKSRKRSIGVGVGGTLLGLILGVLLSK